MKRILVTIVMLAVAAVGAVSAHFGMDGRGMTMLPMLSPAGMSDFGCMDGDCAMNSHDGTSQSSCIDQCLLSGMFGLLGEMGLVMPIAMFLVALLLIVTAAERSLVLTSGIFRVYSDTLAKLHSRRQFATVVLRN